MMKHLLTLLLVVTFCAGTFSAKAVPPRIALESASALFEPSPLGIEGEEITQISFYPNPVKDIINIRFRDKGDYSVKIFNVVGTKIREGAVQNENIIKLNLTDLPKGVYFISYEPGNGKVITKTFTKD